MVRKGSPQTSKATRALRARDVATFLEVVAPPETAVPEDVNGFVFGDPGTVVNGIGVCWSPTLTVLERAAALGLDMIVSHEIAFFYQGRSPWLHDRPTEAKVPNLRRMKILMERGTCVYRAHSNWDVVPQRGNCDAFGAALGFTDETARSRFARVYRVPPTTVRALAAQVKHRVQAAQLRVAGALDRPVSRVALACGGLGQIFNYPEELAGLGAEVAIMGEVLDYTIRHALELDLALIETGHMTSELFGLRQLAGLLREEFPTVRVEFLDCGVPWTWV